MTQENSNLYKLPKKFLLTGDRPDYEADED
jgi:hypothetical protein